MLSIRHGRKLFGPLLLAPVLALFFTDAALAATLQRTAPKPHAQLKKSPRAMPVAAPVKQLLAEQPVQPIEGISSGVNSDAGVPPSGVPTDIVHA